MLWCSTTSAAGHRGTARELGRASAMVGALWCMVATSPFRRTRGRQRSREGGAPVWATSGPNWSLGQKGSLFNTPCSTTLIKGPRSLDQQIKRQLDAKSRVSTY